MISLWRRPRQNVNCLLSSVQPYLIGWL